MGKPDIISIGAGVQDVFLHGKIFGAHRDDGQLVTEFVYGSKNEVEGVFFSTGGGATNAAVTFARHGFHSAFLGALAHDYPGRAVLEDLQRNRVNTRLVKAANDAGTGYSILLLAPSGERTILTYRGASQKLGLTARDFRRHRPDWFYLSSLSGDFDSLAAAISYARKHHIKVAINPGKGELSRSHEFRELLPDISILSLNRDEAKKLFHGDTVEELLRHAAQHVRYVMITDGPKGSVATDGHNLYKAGMYEDVPVVDRTGAGDAFSSGFVASLANGDPMERAITFASANSTNVVSKVGAKAGILPGNAPLHDMPLAVHRL